ncbi:methylated-DNA--[protein]-cysteine S-methyltransferase [Dysgonomonas sp. 216]|uniref:methylated-DNA--[protein]-cysteine S-methyltransferase n=1 Tax=Dysgonomonas sp. 216 TaxID=2302934 RepID=UPI0013D0EEF3|nr:methylated-DNA--[protein]-cysteine S-methyltransferase [Dysgonomonas sp. 216]NDW19311.1 methylated-DNA--[protein]-cysteine S-methyltransferase [Dysgonomonas sp. 216]
MKIAFKNIAELLEDPFFEVRYLGKDAVKMRTFPVEKFGEAPSNFQFADWTKEDEKEVVEYSFFETEIGRLLIANTSKGLCFLGFTCCADEDIKADFIRRFPKALFKEQISDIQKLAVEFCNGNYHLTIPLHLKGTEFQINIWKSLGRIPRGCFSTYGSLAPNAGGAQAIGSAVGANPVSYIIPCHRIVKSDGSYQGYHWGTELKRQLLAYEMQNT